MIKFNPGNKARAHQQQQFFGYAHELVTRMPKLRERVPLGRRRAQLPKRHVQHVALFGARQPRKFHLAIRPHTLCRPGIRLRHRRYSIDHRTTPTRRVRLALRRCARRRCRRHHDALRDGHVRTAIGGGDQRSTVGGRAHVPTSTLQPLA